jgi:hypothetical protein
MSRRSLVERLFGGTSSKSPQYFYEQDQGFVGNPNHRRICKAIAMHLMSLLCTGLLSCKSVHGLADQGFSCTSTSLVRDACI